MDQMKECALVRRAAYAPPCIAMHGLQGDIAALHEACRLAASHPGGHRGGRAEANDRRAEVSEAGSSKRSLGRSSIASGHVSSIAGGHVELP